MEPKSTHVSTGTQHVISASEGHSTVRLETDGIGSAVLHIFDNRHHLSERLDFQTIICLKYVMSRWEDKVLLSNPTPSERSE